MRRVRYSVAASLDGYIAGPNGEFDWIPMDPEIDFGAMMSRFDTILMGRKSWEAAQQMGGAGMPGMTSIVVSRTLSADACPGSTVTADPRATVEALRATAGKDIWLFGGGELFRSMLALGLVDEVEVAIIPILLGGGLPLLPPGGARAPLQLRGHHLYPTTGTVLMEYAVEK